MYSTNWDMLTEKLCYTQLSSSKSEEFMVFVTGEKDDISNQNHKQCFFTCVRNGTSHQKPQRCMPLVVAMDSAVECA